MNSYLLAVSGVSTQFGEAKKNSTWLYDCGDAEFSLLRPASGRKITPKIREYWIRKPSDFLLSDSYSDLEADLVYQ